MPIETLHGQENLNSFNIDVFNLQKDVVDSQKTGEYMDTSSVSNSGNSNEHSEELSSRSEYMPSFDSEEETSSEDIEAVKERNILKLLKSLKSTILDLEQTMIMKFAVLIVLRM